MGNEGAKTDAGAKYRLRPVRAQSPPLSKEGQGGLNRKPSSVGWHRGRPCTAGWWGKTEFEPQMHADTHVSKEGFFIGVQMRVHLWLINSGCVLSTSSTVDGVPQE